MTIFHENEWDVDMDTLPDMDIGESSSTAPIPSSTSPQRLVLQRLAPQHSEDEKSKHTATTSEREGPKLFGQTESNF
jgi:hypothetical protein